MAFQKQSITLKNFTWWLSQDDFLSTWKQVLYAENLDLNTNSYYVSLNKELEWNFVTTGAVNWFITAWTNTFAYCTDWKIYDANTWLVVYTLWDEALNAWQFNGFLYFLTNNANPLNRITITNASSNLWTWNVSENITTTWDSITTAADIYPVVVLLNTKFYIWNGDLVSVVDSSDVITNFDIWDWDIVWITRIGWIFKVYSETWVIAFWDWETDSIDSFVEVQEVVRWVINDGKIDYILAWKTDFQSKVKILNWYTIQDLLLTRDSERLWDYLFKINYLQTNQGWRLSNQLYFVQDGIDSEQLVSYWTWNPTLSKGFNIPLSKDSTWAAITSITAIKWVELTATDRLYIWFEAESVTYIWYIDVNTPTPVYKPAWYMQTNIIDWWSRIQNKKIEEIKLITSDCDVDNTIELLYSVDWWSFTSLQTINSWAWITKTEIYTWKDDFFDIAFKVNFVSDWTTTPKFYEIQLNYTNID